MKRLLVTGSRHWVNPIVALDCLEEAIARLGVGVDEVTVIHDDGALGAMTAGVAGRMGCLTELRPTRGTGALGVDLCLVFPSEEPPGAWDCVDDCRLAGALVATITDGQIVWPDLSSQTTHSEGTSAPLPERNL
jgi:hypothetical protein